MVLFPLFMVLFCWLDFERWNDRIFCPLRTHRWLLTISMFKSLTLFLILYIHYLLGNICILKIPWVLMALEMNRHQITTSERTPSTTFRSRFLLSFNLYAPICSFIQEPHLWSIQYLHTHLSLCISMVQLDIDLIPSTVGYYLQKNWPILIH